MAGVGVVDAPVDSPPLRVIRRRSPLPNGRAVVGGFLVSIAAFGVLLAWMEASRGPETAYVVAARDLVAGTTVEPEDLAMVPMDLGTATSRLAFTDAGRLVGATVVERVGAGELVHPSDIVRDAVGTRNVHMSFGVDSSRALGGNIDAGERVDVIATFGTGPDSYTVAVVERAVVVDIAVDGGMTGARHRARLTLALESGNESLALAHAINAGEVFVVRSGDTESTYSEPYRAPRADGENDR